MWEIKRYFSSEIEAHEHSQTKENSSQVYVGETTDSSIGYSGKQKLGVYGFGSILASDCLQIGTYWSKFSTILWLKQSLQSLELFRLFLVGAL